MRAWARITGLLYIARCAEHRAHGVALAMASPAQQVPRDQLSPRTRQEQGLAHPEALLAFP
jgi:hypothetical protein